MNPQDRQLLDALNQRHYQLEAAVADLRADLRHFAARLDLTSSDEQVATPPPIPVLPPPLWETPPSLPPPIPAAAAYPAEAPDQTPFPPLPVSSAPVEPGPGLEIQFGRWLARIGVVFALLTLVFFSVVAYKDFYRDFGPWSKLGILALVSSGLFAAGLWLERKSTDLIVYGRTLAGGGLACLYYTLYGATYVRQLQVIDNPLIGGFLLLAWSAVVLVLAERRKSELLSVFAISLAYFSSAITPVGGFTMAADLILAVTAVVFLIRNAWTGLSYLCLIGTYLGFVRQIVLSGPDATGDINFVHDPVFFWPWATYLTGAWLIFTAGIFLARTTSFECGKRMAFLCLNNGAWAGLVVVATLLSGHGHLGGTLLLAGGALVGAWALARCTRSEADDLANAYLTQGLALATGGVVIAYTGVTRGLIITVESVFLAAAGAYSRNRILRIGARIAASLGAGFLANEIFWGNAHPWVLTYSGAAAMLANAWFARREFWREPREIAAGRFVLSSAYYVVVALGLLVTGFMTQPSDDWIAPDLAIAALVLTASIYLVPLFELPPLSQLLLVLAQLISFVPRLGGLPASQGLSLGSYAQPLWSMNLVAVITMLMVIWLPRQTRMRTNGWLTPLAVLYALAMVAFTYNSVHPHVSEQNWMMSAAALSLAFLAFGAWNRSWAFIGAGQIQLVLAVVTFFHPDDLALFPWTWWAAAVTIAVVFLTGWAARQFLTRALNGTELMRENLRVLALVYQTVAICLLVRWIFGIVPTSEITLALFALATAFIGGGLFGASSYFVRAGLVLDVVGMGNYLLAPPFLGDLAFKWVDAGAFALFLAQPALLRHWGRELISEAESWLVVLASSAIAWLFVSNSISATDSHNLTLGWALFALALTILGFVAGERRQRWCGLGILAAAFVRVAVHDFWGFSDAGKVLTFFALTVVCLGLSFLYYKFADRLKEWL